MMVTQPGSTPTPGTSPEPKAGKNYASTPAPVLGKADSNELPPDYTLTGIVPGFKPATRESGIRRLDSLDPAPFRVMEMRITSSTGLASYPPELLSRLQTRLANVGLMGETPHYQPGLLDDATVEALQELQRYADRTGEAQLDVLAGMEASGGITGYGQNSDAARKARQGPVTTTRTDTSTTHFDDLDARALANDAYAQATGRAAVGSEAKGVQAALNAYANAHPQISTTTQTVQPDGDVTANTTSRGGISAQGVSQIAEDQAMAAPDYAEYQAATTYFNALQDMLGATANVRGR